MKWIYPLIAIILITGCIRPPTSPLREYEITGTCNLPGYSRDIYVENGYAYIANGQGGLYIVELDSLTVVGSVELPGYQRGVTVSDTLAYLASTSEGLTVVNAADSQNPSTIGFDSWFTAYDLQLSGGMLYIAASYWFIEEDVTHPDFPSYRRRCTTKGDARGVFVDGNFAYVACEEMGVTIINLDDPDSLARVGHCDTPSNARDVYVLDGYAYVADGYGGLQVLDISDPNDPSIVACCDFDGYANKVFVKDGKAYIAAGDGGLKVVDVTDPVSPFLYGECYTSYASSVFVDDFIYVADRDIGILVIQPR